MPECGPKGSGAKLSILNFESPRPAQTPYATLDEESIAMGNRKRGRRKPCVDVERATGGGEQEMRPTRVLERPRQFAFYQKWEDFPEYPLVICPIRLRARVRRLAVSVPLTSILGKSGRFDNIAASLCESPSRQSGSGSVVTRHTSSASARLRAVSARGHAPYSMSRAIPSILPPKQVSGRLERRESSPQTRRIYPRPQRLRPQ